MTPSPRRTIAQRTAIAAIAAAALAKPAEGLYRTAYYDPPGILTACWGHTGPDVKKGVTYSLEQCSRWLDADMLQAVSTVDACQPGLPDPVLIAYSDAVFNLGQKIACDRKHSTAARMLDLARATNGDYSSACRQLPRWNKASVAGVMIPLPGLTTRRGRELDVCLQWKLPEAP